jgi:hypothetical protein
VPANIADVAGYIFSNYLCAEAENFANEQIDEYLTASQTARFELGRLPSGRD